MPVNYYLKQPSRHRFEWSDLHQIFVFLCSVCLYSLLIYHPIRIIISNKMLD